MSPDGVKNILSLGAGVQSTAVLLMSCKGDLPRLDCAIFSDTGWEPKEVYAHFEWLRAESARHGIPVHKVSAGNLKEDSLIARVRGKSIKDEDGKVIHRWASLPYYTFDPQTGSKGMIRRQCTAEYKIAPVEKYIRREILGLKARQRAPKELAIQQWFGISSDEARRAKVCEDKWREFYYPLIMNRLSRQDCHKWLQDNYPERNVPRSACIGCPYHSDEEWRNLRDNSPEEWADAVAFDKKIRASGGMRGETFLHRSCVPLEDVDLDTPEEKGQGDWINECGGMCGV